LVVSDGGSQPKPAIIVLGRPCMARGTGSSNPFPSSAESANPRFDASPAVEYSLEPTETAFEPIETAKGQLQDFVAALTL
jgi:hypothetical protein